MSQRREQFNKPADVTFLLRELRRLSTEPQGKSRTQFWKVVRWHLRERRNRGSC